MCSHEKAHSNDFQDHLHCVDVEEDEIDCLIVSCDGIDFLVQSQKETINNDYKQDKMIKPGIYGHKLDDFVSEWVRN